MTPTTMPRRPREWASKCPRCGLPTIYRFRWRIRRAVAYVVVLLVAAGVVGYRLGRR